MGGKKASSKSRSKQINRSKPRIKPKPSSNKKKTLKPRKTVKKARSLSGHSKKRSSKLQKHESGFVEKVEEGILHEEQLLMRKHVGKYKIPVGVRVLIVYLTFLGILYLVSFFSSIKVPTSIVFGQLVTGTTAIIVSLVILVTLIAILYGLVMRKAYTFDLALIWFGLGLLNGLVSFFLFDASKFSVLDKLMFLSFITVVVVNTLVIWYILSERKYFYSRTFHDRPWHYKDKIFVYTLLAFWMLVVLIGLSYTLSFYGETIGFVDKTVSEISKSNAFFADQICIDKIGKEKDVCLTVLATMQNKTDVKQIAAICGEVESDFLRFTCLRTLT